MPVRKWQLGVPCGNRTVLCKNDPRALLRLPCIPTNTQDNEGKLCNADLKLPVDPVQRPLSSTGCDLCILWRHCSMRSSSPTPKCNHSSWEELMSGRSASPCFSMPTEHLNGRLGWQGWLQLSTAMHAPLILLTFQLQLVLKYKYNL